MLENVSCEAASVLIGLSVAHKHAHGKQGRMEQYWNLSYIWLWSVYFVTVRICIPGDVSIQRLYGLAKIHLTTF
jgi:hypothetical protein